MPNLQPEKPSFEKNLPIALGLMLVVLLISQYFFKPAPAPKPVQTVTPKVATKEAAPPPTAPLHLPNVPGQVEASAETVTQVDTDLYHIVFTNRGAGIKSWVLKKYKDEKGKPLQLLDEPAAAQGLPRPFDIDTADHKLPFDPNSVLYLATVAPGGLGIDYEYSDGQVAVKKTFRFGKDTYLAQITSSIVESGNAVPHFLEWRGGFGDPNAFKASATQHSVRYDASSSKLVTKNVKDAKNGPITDAGDYTFAGLEDNFFAMVALPSGSAPMQIRTYSDDVKGEQFVGAGLSTGPVNSFTLFTGPKDVDLLRKVNPKLSLIINWGFFGIIAKPLFLWLNWTHDHWTANYGWAIIVLTVIINLGLFPLRISSMKSARKMQKVQPLVKQINEKYKNIKMNDPRKAEQNQEVMALYKREGINPLGGCLPMLVQLPILYAFYRVLSIAIELRHAPWLWVTDLSAPESLPIHLLPIIMIVTQLFMQKMTPAAGVDPNQQRMMMFMPIMLGIFFYSLPSGLVLYYLTGNLVGILLQVITNKMMPASAPPSASPAVEPRAPITPPAGKASVRKTVRK